MLGTSMVKRGIQATLVATTRQVQQLGVEIEREGLTLHFAEINEQFELDGPAVGAEGVRHITRPSAEQIALVSTSDICISDNLIWPARFASRFILLANFLWSDYWQHRIGLTPSVALQRDLEQLCAPLISERFANPYLSFSENAHVPISNTYRFLRYPSDRVLEKLRVGNELWVSVGTTGLFECRQLAHRNSDELRGEDVVYRESWKFGSGKLLPWAVFGRPGLGTIRDCMAAGVPFFSGGYDLDDPELRKNAQFAQDFFEIEELVTIWELGNDELQSLRRKLEEKRSRYLHKWSEISEGSDSLLSRILQRPL